MAAVARNGAIGRDNALLWSDPADLQRFRSLTMGHPVIMGRKTWDSLPLRFRPLPGRRNLVLSRDAHWRAEGAERVDGFERALALLDGAPRAVVIGGAQIYAQAMPLADRLELTEIDAELEGDALFPPWDRAAFTEQHRSTTQTAGGVRFDFVTYLRAGPVPPQPVA